MGQVPFVEGATGWRSVVVLGVIVGAALALTSSLGATAVWASTGAARVVDGCTIRTQAPPSGRSCNLRGANLVKGNFAGADLANADLAGAKLIGAKLAGANLVGANLAGSDLSGANMAGADLTGANLTGTNLARADLGGARTHNVTADGVTWDNTVCPDFSDSTGDGGSCQSTNLNGSVVGGGGALAFTGFATAKVALVGTVLVALGLILVFLPAPAKRKVVRAGKEPMAPGR